MRLDSNHDLICFSHLRWKFVFQRPQHLLTRCARNRRVFFFEEPIFDSDVARLETSQEESGVTLAVPHLPPGTAPDTVTRELRSLLDRLLAAERIVRPIAWYYTPMALAFSHHLPFAAVVYDCMDELAGFAGAPQGLRDAERALLAMADVVFTGGHSLFEAKRHLHPNIHPFPSSVDVPHFARARRALTDPADQASVPRPRMGFFGVLDERFDVELLAGVAARRPDWHFVLVGPVVKIDPAILPRAANLHYIGPRTYAQLPEYIAGWDVALLPFARNDATRFISPTKTPEYLAAGRPVVSTSIRDVVRPYEPLGLVRIADTADAFIAAIEEAMREDAVRRLARADTFLARMSWNTTWAAMAEIVDDAVLRRQRRRTARAALASAEPGDTTGMPATA